MPASLRLQFPILILMGFWANTWSNALGGILAGIFFVVVYVVIQWFLQATDLLVSYNWMHDTKNRVTTFHPIFDIRNRSRSKSYRLANIVYTKRGQIFAIDNESISGVVLEPGSIRILPEIATVKEVHNAIDAFHTEITLRTQAGRSFWLRGEGPGQAGKSKLRRGAFKLRGKLESMLIAME